MVSRMITWRRLGLVVVVVGLALRLHGQTGGGGGVITDCYKKQAFVCEDRDMHCEENFCTYPATSNYGPDDIDLNGFLLVDYSCPEGAIDVYTQTPNVEECVSAQNGGYELTAPIPDEVVCWITYPCLASCTKLNVIAESGEFVVGNDTFRYKVRKAVCDRMANPAHGESDMDEYYQCVEDPSDHCPPPPSP
jgi:hypothetical protein